MKKTIKMITICSSDTLEEKYIIYSIPMNWSVNMNVLVVNKANCFSKSLKV